MEFLDNKIMVRMIAEFKKQGLDYQLALQGNHQVVGVERAISIFKNCFVAIRSGTDPVFSQKGLTHLIHQAEVILNMLRPSRINPCISVYTQVHGIFHFNCTPLAPADCKIIIHDQTDEQPSWSDHGSWGHYVGQVMKYFQKYNVLMDATKKI